MSNSAAPPNGIVYFHYPESPYARRVVWYLALRNIGYSECIQPRIMPRPDLAALGVRYRKTPTMAIGRDVYVDSRMIISRLEELFPPSEQHPAFSTKETAGLAGLLNKLNIDVAMFSYAVMTMPPDIPLLHDESFVKDRSEYFGGSFPDFVSKNRTLGLVHQRQCFDIIESLLGDEHKWVGGADKPTLADLEGVWVIDWFLANFQPPAKYFSASIYPKVYAWRERFMKEVEQAKSRAPQPVRLEGSDAVSAILNSDFSDKSPSVDSNDPIELKAGTAVEVYPTDGGGHHDKDRDRGSLIKLTKDEVAISVRSNEGDKEVHIHAPRWNFKIREASGSRL